MTFKELLNSDDGEGNVYLWDIKEFFGFNLGYKKTDELYRAINEIKRSLNENKSNSK